MIKEYKYRTVEERKLYDVDVAKEALNGYRKLYERNCCRIDAEKHYLLSLQVRTMLLMLVLEKFIESDNNIKSIRDIKTLLEYNNAEVFRRHILTSIVPEISLEGIFRMCEYAEVLLSDIRKRAIRDILINLNEQRDKRYYEKFNKLYSVN